MSNDDERYNGWTNRETWAVALYINNDEGWLESVLEALREARGEVIVGDEGYEEADVPLKDWQAGDLIRENVEEHLSPDTEGWDAASWVEMAYPILFDIGSLWRVNWQELGASFLADLEE